MTCRDGFLGFLDLLEVGIAIQLFAMIFRIQDCQWINTCFLYICALYWGFASTCHAFTAEGQIQTVLDSLD